MAELGTALLICFASWCAQCCLGYTSMPVCQGNTTCSSMFYCLNCIICLVALFFMFK